jgi:hypothetical protein
MKNNNDTIENRTRDLPACSAVPLPTAPPRTPKYITYSAFKYLRNLARSDNELHEDDTIASEQVEAV